MLIDIKSLPFSKKVNGIIHIGAHECEERGAYIQQFNITDEHIIWIDALKSKVDIIKNNEPYIKIFNECISDKDNELVVFKITNNFQSSSFLNLKEHLIEHPDIHEIYRIELYTKTLKTFYNENNLNRGDYNFMNLDIQGAELLALKGAGDILTNIDYIYIEVNTKELYENCALLSEVDEYLSTFHFKRLHTYITSHGWGDAFYIKNIHYISDNLKIEYGVDTNKIDITDVVFKKCIVGDIIHIPCPDGKRAEIFSDPLWGVIKKIFITSDDNNFIMEHDDEIYIDIQKKQLYINEAPVKMNSSTNVEETSSELKLLRLPLTEFNHSPSTSSTARNTLLNKDRSYSLDNPFHSPNNNKKYKFCIMAIFKNETMNLRIWLDHYLWQGVEHFYLIDNGSTDNPLDILNEYIDKEIVTYYYRAEKYQQPQHYRYVFDNENLKNKTQWLSICDLDEFFFGTNKKLINVLEDDFSNFDIIYTNSYFYGSDNLINHPKDIRTAIVHRQENLECGTKYIFKPSIITDSSEIWIHWLVHSGTLQKKIFNKETFDMKIIRLNHYNIQSLEYFQKVKMTRGDVSVVENENIRDMNVFKNSNNLSIIKDDILKQIIEYNIYDKNGEVMRFYDEYSNIIDNNSIEKPEQDLTNEYILEDDIVLELGARYGSVSCSINKKLNNKYNQISVEPDDRVWTALELNKIKNNCNFNIVKGFVSNKQLNLINLGEGLGGYGATFIEDNNTKIPSYSLNEIKKTYQISKFTAMVADCEGFLEEFFNENPNLYEDLRIIIFEADYADKCNYDKIKQQLTFHKFIKILEGHQNVWIKEK
jgi:FkbM family methyltransferase